MHGAVSIPSSRVGTAAWQVIAREMLMFPSPQVGSERAAPLFLGVADGRFPSPQVGSEHVVGEAFSNRFLVSIPSSRVGTEPGHEITVTALVFPSPQVGSEHPTLFSVSNAKRVSIPSSRVGTRRRGDVVVAGMAVSIPSSRVGT